MSVRIRRPSVRVRRRSVRPGEGDVLYAEEVSLVDRAVQLEEARRASHEAGAPSVDRTREGDPRRSSSGREGADPGRPGRFERLPSTGGVGNDDGLERRRREDGTSSSPIREFPVDPNAIEEAEGTLAARHNRAIADAAIERELKAQRALHWKDRMAPTGPTEERKAGRPKRRASIVAALASRHRVAQERRDEARRQRRLDRFAELHPLRDIPEGSAQAPQDTVQTRHEALTSMTAQPQRSSSRGSRIRASSPRSDAGSSAASGSSSGGAVAWFRGLADPERDLEAVNEEEQHASEVVDHLDVVDPGISTVAHLTNVGNSIMFPPIPRLYSRMPVVDLPQPSAGAEADAHQDMEAGTLKRRGTRLSLAGGADELDVHVSL